MLRWLEKSAPRKETDKTPKKMDDALKSSNSFNVKQSLMDSFLCSVNLKTADFTLENEKTKHELSNDIEMTDISESSDVDTSSDISTDNRSSYLQHSDLSSISSKEDIEDISLKTDPSINDATVFKVDSIPRHLLKVCKVQCLESVDALRERCEEMDLYFNDGKVYEVDFILDYKEEHREKMYLIKWKNYDLETNTWEPRKNLVNCKELLYYFDSVRRSRLDEKMLQYFVQDLVKRTPVDTLTLRKLYSLLTKDDTSEASITELKLMARSMLDRSKFPWTKLTHNKSRLMEIIEFYEKRKEVLVNLKEWELDLNTFNNTPYMVVENEVDLEGAPKSFHFISDYMYTDVEVPPKATAAYCSCDNCYDSKITCCPQGFEAAFAYTKSRRLKLQPGYPIYECNDQCKCGPDCANRVVQHGSKIKLAIFRTSNGRGWGLRTLEPIQKDQFVLEYLGEIITSETAEQRGLVYDYVGKSYLFDLDYGVDDCMYTVDACHAGNASHFINHSCDPNLCVFAVWINQQNPQLPRLAFFARRKIARGEELTFDYKMVTNRDLAVASESTEKIPCLCNSKNCRKYMMV